MGKRGGTHLASFRQTLNRDEVGLVSAVSKLNMDESPGRCVQAQEEAEYKFGFREDVATSISRFFLSSGILPDVLILLLSCVCDNHPLVAKKVIRDELVKQGMNHERPSSTGKGTLRFWQLPNRRNWAI